MWVDCLLIVVASLVSALISEALSWLLIYRTENYKKLSATIEKLNKKLERTKGETGSAGAALSTKKKTKEKKIDRYEESLKTTNRELAMSKMKSMFAVGFTLITLFTLLNSVYDGYVVARLPFEPFSLIRGISHRGLAGTNYYDCSMVFIYVLCSMSIRNNVQKLLGFAPPKSAGFSGLFQPPTR